MRELEEAYQVCQSITREGAKNFYYAFLTLPAAKREAIYAAYAFCRVCDDITDEALPTDEKVRRLDAMRQALGQAYAGRPSGPILLALKDTADTYGIPQAYFQEVVQGVEMDLTRTRYPTFDDLWGYCYRVASAVGLICIEVFGYDDPRAQRCAVDLGLAMQLTNILRDLQEDADRGRIYLPQDEMERFGYSEGELLSGAVNARFRALMAFQAQRARKYFVRGACLDPLLSRRSRGCSAVLHGLYSRLLDRIEERGYDVFSERVRLPTPEKALLTLRLWTSSFLFPAVRRS